MTAVSAPVALAGVESSQRLRLNQLLNTSGKMGRGAGNALGVLGLLFASFESFSGYLTNGQVRLGWAGLGRAGLGWAEAVVCCPSKGGGLCRQ